MTTQDFIKRALYGLHREGIAKGVTERLTSLTDSMNKKKRKDTQVYASLQTQADRLNATLKAIA